MSRIIDTICFVALSRPAFVAGLTLAAGLAPLATRGQVRLVEENPGPAEIRLGEAYVQNFDSLQAGDATMWRDDHTLPGWLANFTRGQVSTGALVARSPERLRRVADGSVGAPAALSLLVRKNGDLALGGTPGAFAPGAQGIFSSESVNIVLRLQNATRSVLTGLRIAYDTVAADPANRDAVALAYRVFPAGSGTVATDFIETHRYLNEYNGTFTDSMRTEFGRRTSSAEGWICLVKDVAPLSPSAAADRREFVLRDLAVPPGAELWLVWHISKEDERGPEDPVTTTAIDNVRLDRFTVGRPGMPAISASPRPLSVALGADRGFTLDVSATGDGLRYQWRRDGAEIAGATGPRHAVSGVEARHAGSYDVVVSNAAGSITSRPARVVVYAPREVVVRADVDFDAPSSSIKGLATSKTLGTRGDLYLPAGLAGPTPAVIVIHGGGGNNGDKADNREVEASRELAARGWIVLSINYAMSSHSARCWPRNLWDAKQAVRWLRRQAETGAYPADPDRIGALGFSWGCNLASMLALTGPESDAGVADESLRVEPPARGDVYDRISARVRCSAVFYGANDLPNYHRMKQFHQANAWTDRALYRRASPVAHPNPDAAPMLFVHGSADDDVWPSQTESTYLLQRSLGARVEPYLIVPGGEHSFRLYETKRIAKGFPRPLDLRPQTLGFFEQNLMADAIPPAVLADPASHAARAGEKVALETAVSGAPSPALQWRKDGVALPGATSARLEITAGADTAGYYDVVATNAVGSIASAAGRLVIER